MKVKLNSSVSIVKLENNIIEFFKTNTRQQIRIRTNDDTIMNILNDLNGENTIQDISKKHNIDINEIKDFVSYLSKNAIIDNVQTKYDFKDYDSFRRVIHFIEDYSESHQHLVDMWNNIQSSQVLIIGVGAVGTWVAVNLVQSGVKNIILMDPDTVDITNLHRQFGYTEENIGEYKVDVLSNVLKKFNPSVNISTYKYYLNDKILSEFNNQNISLIINCADKPNVDTTSNIVGEYCMTRKIPHIVGGGYNLHLSLIGQSIIPLESACVKCFEKSLNEENSIDSTKVKKLIIPNRKIGSFAPMCSTIASIIGMESIKILTKNIIPANINRRGEFDIYSMNIKYKQYERRDDCEWCGKSGIYNS